MIHASRDATAEMMDDSQGGMMSDQEGVGGWKWEVGIRIWMGEIFQKKKKNSKEVKVVNSEIER